MYVFQKHQIWYEAKKNEEATRKDEAWRVEVVTLDGGTWTDSKGKQRPLTTGTGQVAWFSTLKRCKAWAERNAVHAGAKALERHAYAPELNRLHMHSGKVHKAPGCTTFEQAVDYVVFSLTSF
jgi:hypothetical protein